MLEAQQLKESKVEKEIKDLIAATGGHIAYMSVRDYFAAAARQGILEADTEYELHETKVAEMAYRQADAMLAERAK